MKVTAKDQRVLETLLAKAKSSGPMVSITEAQLAAVQRVYNEFKKAGPVPVEMKAVAQRLGLVV